MSQYPVDEYITAAERRLAPLLAAEPRDPAGRRRVAEKNDAIVSHTLGFDSTAVRTSDEIIGVPDHGSVRVRVYWPTGESGDTAPLPIVIWMYGGAFTIGGIDWVSWDTLFRERAAKAGVILVAVDYGRAPETRFPVQPEQCYAALVWAHRNATRLGGDPGLIAIGGTSSGGNLAAVTTLINRDRDDVPVLLQVLEVPSLDLTLGHLDLDAVPPGIPPEFIQAELHRLVQQYADDDDRRTPYASPLLATSLAGVPAAVVHTAEWDPLRGDGEAYLHALILAGVPASGVRWLGQTHTSAGLRGVVPAADRMQRAIVEDLRSLHEAAPSYPDPSAP